MKGSTIIIIVLSIVALVLLGGAIFAACSVFGPEQQPSEVPGAAFTQAYETAYAQVTQDAASTAIAKLTEISGAVSTATPGGLPTFPPPTQPPPTFAVPSPTSIVIYPTPRPPTPTAPIYIPPSNTPVQVPCDRATFIKDVTIPDGTNLPAGAKFTKIWRVRNDGSCTWDSSYALVFVSGSALANVGSVPVPGIIVPGQAVDIAVDMTAPTTPGSFQSNWMLRSPRGSYFGVGKTGDNPLWVRITVSTPPTPNPKFAYDLVANYCNAQWRTNAGVISCTQPSNDARGSVSVSNSPNLENRVENEPALVVRPDQANNGFIYGQYPAYTIKPGDRFITEISCSRDMPACNIVFRLDYVLANGTVGSLGAWFEKNDGKTQVLNIDLSGLVGQAVQFVLRVQNNGDYRQAVGIWFVPSVRNQPPPSATPPPPPTSTSTSTPTVTPTWTPVTPYP